MTIPQTIERWHRIALERRSDELAGIPAEGCVFESPVVHTPQVGKAICEAYLRGALQVLNTEHFRYGGYCADVQVCGAPMRPPCVRMSGGSRRAPEGSRYELSFTS